MVNSLKYIAIRTFLLTIAFSSCQSFETDRDYENQEVNRIEIDLSDAQGEIHLSSVIESFEYVPLETTSGSLMGNPWDIKSNDDYIVTFHNQNVSYVGIFKRDGDFIHKIEIPQRDGPGGLFYPSYFDVDFENREIIVLGFRKLNRYNFEGEVLDEVVLDFSPSAVQFEDDQYIFFMGNTNYQDLNESNSNVIITDHSGNIENTYLPIQPSHAGLNFITSSHFTTYDGEYYLNVFPGYDIYRVSSDEATLHHQLDFGSRSIPDENYSERSSEEIAGNQSFPFFERLNESEYVGPVSGFFEFNNMIQFTLYTDRTDWYTVFLKKDTGDYLLSENWINDIDGTGTPFFRSANDEYLMTVTEPMNIIEGVENLEIPESELKSNLIEVSKNINENDNPVVIFAKVK